MASNHGSGGGVPPAIKFIGIGLGVVAAAVLVVWLLLFNGLSVVFGVLPPGLVKLIGEKPGGQRVMPAKAEQAPWETDADYARRKAGQGSVGEVGSAASGAEPAEPDEDADEPVAAVARKGKSDDAEPEEAAEEPAAPAKTDDVAAAEAAMAPIKVVAAQADEAIAAFQDDAENQGLFLAASAKIETIKQVPIETESDALRTAAAEFVKDAVLQRQNLLQNSKKAGRATHRVAAVKTMPYIAMRKAASATADFGGHLTAGQLVRVHIDAGGGWVRVEVLTGDNVGSYGYARAKYLIALKNNPRK